MSELYPYEFIHQACGKPAFYLRARPQPGSIIASAEAQCLDGSKPEPLTAMCCGSCGELLHNDEMATSKVRARIPTLTEWLGDGTRADGFEEFVRAQALAEQSTDDEGVKATVRVLRTLVIAMVEVGRRELEAGVDDIETSMRMARGLAYAFMVAMESRRDETKEGTIEELGTISMQLFAEGVNFFISQCKEGGDQKDLTPA